MMALEKAKQGSFRSPFEKENVLSSDGSRGSAEARCHTGAAIPNSPPSGNYVQISEEKRGEIRRPSDIRQKPNISGSLILAGVFAGAAIIIGKIFSWKN